MTTSINRFSTIVLATLFAGTASGAAPAMTSSGPHASEEFCKIMVRQVEEGAAGVKPGMSADNTERAKYNAGQKVWNTKLVKTAPASLASDVALSTKAANDFMDADIDHRAKAAQGLTSPERMAANKRMSDYCGFKV